MGITSAAEAKLDARIRPDITVLRSRTSYPRRHRPPLSVIAGGAGARPSAAAATATAESSEQFAASSSTQTFARTVSTERTTWRVARTERTVVARAAAARRTTTAADSAGTRARSAGATSASAPIRLTRRGRFVVGAAITMAVAALTALIWLAVAGRADAASHVRPGGSAGNSMLRVVVRPGQTLWSIATKADPAADPRAVIQEIVDDNALAGTAVQAGQVLWVPRG
jgi:nucleoid-associated protein YgaU